MHKRKNPSAPGPLRTDRNEAAAADDPGQRVSPARERAADQVVQRATRGLMRVDSRRKMRWLFRRLFFLLIMLGAIAGLYYCFADRIPMELLNEYWEQLRAKLLPAVA